MFHCNSHSASIAFGWFRLTLHEVDVSYVGVTQSESGENRFYPSTFVMRWSPILKSPFLSLSAFFPLEPRSSTPDATIPGTNPKILTDVVPEIPSWTYPPIRNCPFLETKKQGLLDEEMRAIFLAHLERHPTVHIYTDGSKSTEGVGFAAVFPNTTSGGRLTGEASIFTAELYAINAAVHEILKGTIDGNRFTIFFWL